MEEAVGTSFVVNLLNSLRAHGIVHTLPITTHLKQPAHPGNNLCLSRLRPMGICCAYSGVDMHFATHHTSHSLMAP